jgi:hypothetical protein
MRRHERDCMFSRILFVKQRTSGFQLPLFHLTVLAILAGSVSCGGSRPPDNPPPTSCFGLHCATLPKRFDNSCPQFSGKNNRTYAAATQANLTVYFFYLINQYDGQGNVTPSQNSATLQGSTEVPLSCDYDFKNGTQYQYDIVKECATTRSGATLANCTSQEQNLEVKAAANFRSMAVRSQAVTYDTSKLVEAKSQCTDICQMTTTACLKVGFTQAQTVDLDKATGMLFGIASKNPLSGCKESLDVTPDASNMQQRSVSVTGSANQCVVDINSRAGTLELLITKGSKFNTSGDKNKFAMAPSTEETAVIQLPIADWQKMYGGRVLATEGTQASTVITTENGCIRLQRFH